MLDVRARLDRYVAALLEANTRLNLTAARTPERALEVLVEPSLAVALAWPADRPPPALAVDVGSGNGFPGVAVAALWPDCRVLLVERRAKKARAVAACLAAAGLANAEAVACDARELRRERPGPWEADLVTVRAVGSVEQGNRLAAPLLGARGRVVHWKRPSQLAAEGPGGDAAARALGLRRLPDVAHAGAEAVLVLYERTGARP